MSLSNIQIFVSSPSYFSYNLYESDYIGNPLGVYHNFRYQNGDRKHTELQHVYTLAAIYL